MNANENVEKSIIISAKVGVDVHKSVIEFVYASRELNCWDRWAFFTGVLNLFISQSDMDSCRNTYRHYYCRCSIRTADGGD